MPARTTPSALLIFAVASTLASCVSSRSPETVLADASAQDPRTKPAHVSSELLSIYEKRYSSSTSESHACSDVDRAQVDSGGSVVVEALAKENADLLLNQLTSIGLKHTQVAAPVVSGYLPICAIPQLESCCSELKFVRRSVATIQDP